MQKIPDVNIGYRCEAYVRDYATEKGITIKEASSRIGISKKSVYNWAIGNAPGAVQLTALVESGADANYLLTGRKKDA